MIVIACPGQGSQTPGFLEPWLAGSDAKRWLREMSERIEIDLVKHGTVSDAETIRATNIAQPLIVAAGILSLNSINAELAKLDTATAAVVQQRLCFAGHSVGEITAAYGAGVFNALAALEFVAARSRAMQRCAGASATSMAAVLGAATPELQQRLEELQLTVANYNGAGQLVVAGALANVAKLVSDPPAKTRVIQLRVAGAFHTDAMAQARDELTQAKQEFLIEDPKVPLYTNRDGSVVDSGSAYLELLISQIATPVRWDLCMESLLQDGVSQLVELAPSGALSGLAKRAMKGVAISKISTPEDVKILVTKLTANAQND
ncbi:ACP S-malonyltransferase [Canibacter sp. lx-72]|uniref:ACP S-malonyltransferase n=1 Tax=Canibacter zhuwentaonis TaxID=2837491 RepID=UPI001BDC02C4|nr:ACP S-malonyltransferase [Canibacter zhuwentaonis]MBT1018510.1 ACP S-malonyltransferase [Canibacter zhuwentaonis]MBT1035649.1 ACP S-malonyltransferase [Canibacter zhuwentaonis]